MTYDDLFRRSLECPTEFWREQAAATEWFRPPDEILSPDESGWMRWFRGGQLNTCYLALDRHVAQGRGEQPALIYDSPVTGVRQSFTYRRLLDDVARFAGALRGLGVERGDRVVLYLPMIPQTVVAMLACARLGAVHSVVFGGFAPHELAVRIDDAQPRVLVTASAGREGDRTIPYLPLVRQALAECAHPPEVCVVRQRDLHREPLAGDRERDWDALVEQAEPAHWVAVDALDPLYILYTSGATGRPKGIVRDHGGHAVALQFSMSALYGMQPGETFWAASDVGWVVGHSYIVYGPLLHGCTTVLYEGKPVRTPDAGAFWRVAAEHGVRALFTAPTAIRAIRREDPAGELLRRYDLSRLRTLFLAGERCDAATLQWAREQLSVPVLDHWWQTESGWPMAANPCGYGPLPVKPGSVTKPVCGYDVQVLDWDGRPCRPREEGAVAVRLPLPPGCLTGLWRNPERFRRAYLEAYPGYYLSGDGGYFDEDGYLFITGRTDDVINVAGHRLSTAAMEEVVASHPAVAECAVIGVEDALKGQLPLGFVVLRRDRRLAEDELARELVQLVRERIGAVASFKRVLIVPRLPKTRSGKILRGVMRSLAAQAPFAPPSTIEDPSVLEELAAALRPQ